MLSDYSRNLRKGEVQEKFTDSILFDILIEQVMEMMKVRKIFVFNKQGLLLVRVPKIKASL